MTDALTKIKYRTQVVDFINFKHSLKGQQTAISVLCNTIRIMGHPREVVLKEFSKRLQTE